jgi:hypothetical protein
MNKLDMYTREKANQRHLEQMYREVSNRRLLRMKGQDSGQLYAHLKRWPRFAISFAVLVVFLGAFTIFLKLF